MASKVSKKEIRRNELKELIIELQEYVKERLVTVLIVGGLVVFLGIILPGGFFYKKQIDKKAIRYLDNGLAFYEKARLSGDNKAYEESQAAFSKIISNYALSSSTPMALLYMGNTFYHLDNFNEAKRAYFRFLKKYPRHTFAGLAQRGVAMASEMAQDYENAVLEYQKLADEYPQFSTTEIQLSLAYCLEELQRLDEAIAIYEDLVPENTTAKLRLARLNQKNKV